MSTMPEMVEIYDSTLRDGAQAEGIAYSVEDKLLIARRLDRLGVHYIEGGWPNPTNPKDLAFFAEVRKLNLQAQVTAFGSTRRAGRRPEEDEILNTLLRAETESIAIFGKSWTLHATEVLRTTLEENLRMIEDSVAFLVGRDREVIYDAEHFFDGYKADPGYALKTLLAARRGGARILVLCDTNGGTLTSELSRIVEAVKSEIGAPFGIHTHNDAGVGVANTLAAVELGAVQVQGTFNGYGERCGNANLCSIIPNLELKMNRRTIGREKVQELMRFSRFLSEIANVYHDHRQPYVGESAFAHKGGAHVDGVMKVAHSFEHVEPETVGNERRFLVSDQSGGGTIVSKLSHIIPGIDKKDPLVGTVLEKVKQLENQGYQYEAAEGSFELMVRRAMGSYEDLFKLVSFRTINRKTGEKDEESEAIVKVAVDGQIYHTVADGDGPVNALDQALRKGLEVVYPSIRQVHLEDYKVRVLSSSDGTAAKVRVLIESSDGRDAWGTVGVSGNIIEASWIALADSLHFKLMKDALAIEEAMEERGVEGDGVAVDGESAGTSAGSPSGEAGRPIGEVSVSTYIGKGECVVEILEEGGVTSARGFRASGVRAGIKPGSQKEDLALVYSTEPASGAAVYTTNRVQAAPIAVDREHLAAGQARAVVLNSGNANACTGERGLEDARRMCRLVAGELGLAEDEVLVCSTGVIGVPMPMGVIEKGIPAAAAALSEEGGATAARAIMTTDTMPKSCAVEMEIGGRKVRVGGMAKGSGMIAPNMATMLSVITTDAAIEAELLQEMLRRAAQRSFNCVTVDGDMSTNDTVIALANGAAGGTPLAAGSPEAAMFYAGFEEVCRQLARLIARDGEGATKLVVVRVRGARHEAEARQVGMAVANSSLVKTAIFGNDPNWGRILCAVGYSGVELDPGQVEVSLCGTPIYGEGAGRTFDKKELSQAMKVAEIPIDIDLRQGEAGAEIFTCDFSYEYVRINAEYTT